VVPGELQKSGCSGCSGSVGGVVVVVQVVGVVTPHELQVSVFIVVVAPV
jgi:hypothetical protein